MLTTVCLWHSDWHSNILIKYGFVVNAQPPFVGGRREGTAGAEIKVPSAEYPKLSKNIYIWSKSEYRLAHFTYCQIDCLSETVHSTSFYSSPEFVEWLGYSFTWERSCKNVYWLMTVFGRPEETLCGRQDVTILWLTLSSNTKGCQRIINSDCIFYFWFD